MARDDVVAGVRTVTTTSWVADEVNTSTTVTPVKEMETTQVYHTQNHSKITFSGRLASSTVEYFDGATSTSIINSQSCSSGDSYDHMGRSICQQDRYGIERGQKEELVSDPTYGIYRASESSSFTSNGTRLPQGSRQSSTPSGFSFRSVSLDENGLESGAVTINEQQGTGSALLAEQPRETRVEQTDGTLISKNISVFNASIGELNSTQVQDANGNALSSTLYEYSDVNDERRLEKVTTGSQITEYLHHFDDGQVRMMKEPDGTYVETVRDGLGRVQEIRRGDSAGLGSGTVVRHYEYYPYTGQVKKVRSSFPQTYADAEYTYGPYGVSREKRWGSEEKVEYTHDVDGRVVRQTIRNASSNAHPMESDVEFDFDVQGREVMTCDNVLLACNTPGRLPQPGEKITEYDTKDTSASAVGNTGAVMTNNIYQQGRVTSIQDYQGKTFYEYDELGRIVYIVREDMSHGNAAGDFYVVHYDYDGDRLLRRSFPSATLASAKYEEYFYDALDRLEKITVDGDTIIKDIEYDARGMATSWKWANNDVHSIAHNDLGFITAISDRYDNAPYTVSYSYDDEGDQTLETTFTGTISATVPPAWLRIDTQPPTADNASVEDDPQVHDRLYGYGRPAAITGNVNFAGEGLTYDNRGRRAAISRNKNSAFSVGDFLYQSEARGFERIRLVPQATTTQFFEQITPRYNYSCTAVGNGLCDRAGRMHQIDWKPATGPNPLDVSSMKYSAVGSLSGLTTPAGGFEYGYDHAVRRVAKKQPLGTDRVRFRYGLGADVLEEKVYDAGSETHTLQYVYFAGMKVAAIHTDKFAVETKLRFHNDRMGTVRMVSEKDDAIARVIMDPWGQASDGTIDGVGVPVYDDPAWIGLPVQHRRAGQYEDVESRLIENRYRTLVPELGGYVSPEPQHANTLARFPGVQSYSYVAGRPLLLTDPDGLTATQCTPLRAIRGECSLPGAAFAGNPAGVIVISAGASLYVLCHATGICSQQPQPAPNPAPQPPTPPQPNGPEEMCIEPEAAKPWKCTAKGQLFPPPNCQGYIGGGVASSQSQNVACREAKRLVTQSAPLGCYARHIQCSCWK